MSQEQVNVEWQAWQSVIAEMKQTFSVDSAQLNHPVSREMFNAIRRWGEELVALRQGQSREVVDKALQESRELYPQLVEGDEE